MTLNEYISRHNLADSIPMSQLIEIETAYEDNGGDITHIDEDDVAELLESFGFTENDEYSPNYDESEEENF